MFPSNGWGCRASVAAAGVASPGSCLEQAAGGSGGITTSGVFRKRVAVALGDTVHFGHDGSGALMVALGDLGGLFQPG